MSMILRSTKTFPPFARNVIFKSNHETIRVLSTTFTQHRTSSIQPIKKLEQEIRRTGRITRRGIEEGLQEIHHNGTVSSAQSLLLIRCCGYLVPDELPKNRMAFVQNVWRTLNNLNAPMDISHYNALLQVYLKNEHSFHPTTFMADMESKGVEPNRVTYQHLVSKYCQEGDIDGATKVVEFMREEQLPINEHVFNALIMGHSEANDIKSAIGILSAMEQAGLAPTSDTYTHLMCGYAKHGMTDEMLSTLNNCEANEIYLLDKDLFKIIYQLATNGHSDFVDNIITRLRKLPGYSQNVDNLIGRLVMAKSEDVAFKILKTIPPATRPDGEPFETGAFFIRTLIESGRPTGKILSICKELQQTGLNSRAMLIAAEMAAQSGNVDTAIPFFREAKRNGLPLRQEWFWPLLCAQGKIGTDAVINVLRVMHSEFGMTANGQTVRDYVIPNLKERNYEKIVLMLEASGVPKPIAVTSSVCHALTLHQIKVAAALASTYAIYYEPNQLRRLLVDALLKTNDFQSWVSIVRSVYENLPRLHKLQNANKQRDDCENPTVQSDVVGKFVVDAVINLQGQGLEILQNILAALVKEGLSMSNADAERIRGRMGSTPKISFLLEKLTSGKLEPVPYKSRAKQFTFSDIMPTSDLHDLIRQKEAKGEYTKGYQWALLQSHLKANDVQKTEELIEKLVKSTGFVLTTPTYSQLIDLYCTNNDLDKALAVYAEIKSKEPDFVLDILKTIKIVHGLVTTNRINEAIEFLKAGRVQDQKLKDNLNVLYNSLCWRLLNHLAEKGKDADLTDVFNALEENNFIKVNNVLLGLLIKVHLVNNDIAKAMASFEIISTKYKRTPWKNELSCTLIQLKDATTLQFLVDLSTKVHGEVDSLYDLVFSFIECGCIQQARRILQTPALHNKSQALIDACERYRRERRTPSLALETLARATSDLKHIDRHEVYYNLLLAYCKEESPIKAMNLWMRVDKELVVADKFLTTLAKLLNENGVKIPFAVPLNEVTKAPLKAGILDDAVNSNDHLDSNTDTNVTTETKMLGMMVKENQLDIATQHVLKMLDANTCPSSQTFRLYLNSMARAGQYQAIEQLSPHLNSEFKKKVMFDNRLGRAYASAGKAEQYFDQTIKNCINATTEEELKQAFPSGAISGVLDKHPELVLKFQKFAEDMADREFLVPIKIMWSHHIENGKLDEADRICSKYFSESPPIVMFNSILRTALYRNDEKIALNLLNLLADRNVAQMDLAAIHCCLIDVYCSQQRFDEALKAVDGAIRAVSLENIKRATLVFVKDGLESEGKVFPHKIPDKKKLNAAGDVKRSNSSDDELRGKWDEFRQILENIFEENVKI
ncbi:leucine-rich PPR motif-containing protein, mitochondrial-like [Bradysia coprophila]|uniref:leucine-rich PPR motif-containing protein, mitochondrial-like n=1 Tax=Bradysia coprophila TaxID=38358 RepID=UPI00187D753F|nr:leucine-rich PPR motif-containing protein, mitochondrial-like [Bradysia coprophila]